MTRSKFFAFLATVGLWVEALPAAEVDTALIESVVLLNFDALSGNVVDLSAPRNRRAHPPADNDPPIDIFKASPGAPGEQPETDLGIAIGALLAGHTDDELAEAVAHAIDYTLDTGPLFGADFEAAMKALEIFTKAAFEASDGRNPVNGEPDPNPIKLIEKLFVDPNDILKTAFDWAIINNKHIPTVGREVAKAVAKGAMSATINNASKTDIAENLAEKLTTATLDLLEEELANGVGFFRGIVPVIKETANPTMLYDQYVNADNNKEKFRFHPDKTRFIEYVVSGFTDGIVVESVTPTTANSTISSLAKAIGAKATEAVVAKLGSLTDGDHSLFLYETIKAIGYGTSMSSVLATGTMGNSLSMALGVAEEVSFGVAATAVKEVLAQPPTSVSLATALQEIAKVGEAAAYGTSMGTGLAGSMLTGFDRAELAKSAAQGAAKGAMQETANKLSNTENDNDELLALARGTAMGSVLGSVAMSVYNHLDANVVDVQKVIEAAAQGTAFGSMTADLVNDDGSPRDKLAGHKEDFEVEIARAVATGASTGALFEITTLLQTKPDSRVADIDSIKTAKSVSYGATKGAILGGDAAGVSSDVSVKLAAEQGLTEGSLDGVALAQGKTIVTGAVIKSEAAIKHAIGVGNRDAAVDAARDLAIKAINPPVEDMLQLMKLYGINPKLTNPGFIFPNPNRAGEDNFLFEDDKAIPIVSPI